MAAIATLSASVGYDDELETASLSVTNRSVTSAGARQTRLIQNVGTSPEALQMGEITSPGVVMLKNLDPTNFIEVKTGTGGDVFAKLKPDTLADGTGGFCVLDCAGSDAQAPYVVADTAACRMAVLVVEA